MNYTMNRGFDRLESAKLRALRTKNVLTYQRALHVYVLTCQRALSAYVLTYHRGLRAHVLTCHHTLSPLPHTTCMTT